jgi:hypothetical protein
MPKSERIKDVLAVVAVIMFMAAIAGSFAVGMAHTGPDGPMVCAAPVSYSDAPVRCMER